MSLLRSESRGDVFHDTVTASTFANARSGIPGTAVRLAGPLEVIVNAFPSLSLEEVHDEARAMLARAWPILAMHKWHLSIHRISIHVTRVEYVVHAVWIEPPAEALSP